MDSGSVEPYVEELVPPPDPAECCERLEGLPYRLFLDSATRDPRLGRYSFVSADPIAVIRSRGAYVERIDPATGTRRRVGGDARAALRAFLSPFHASPIPGLPPFQGGAAGYVAYEWGLVLERLPAPRYDDLELDDVVFGVYDWVLAWDHAAHRAWLISTGMPETSPGPCARRAAARADEVRRRLHASNAVSAVRRTEGPARAGHDGHEAGAGEATAPSYQVEDGWWDPRLSLRSSFTRNGYVDAVSRVRDYIFAGDIFQANLSQRFEAPIQEPPWSLYRRLRTKNPAPFSAFLELPSAAIVSASPERFLRVDSTGQVETRPIKGTRPRGVGPEHDAALGQALAESPKDRAENLMIVDLMRNDLSRVCAPGTVRVAELCALEQYATVHHLVSTVVGQLAPGADALDLLRAAFPGGSITGAPKLRAMEIIAELELSRRGVYCGAIGYWSRTGDLDTSIAIRTAVARGGRVYFNAGGGVVADSDPGEEYQETLDKARGIIDALAVPA